MKTLVIEREALRHNIGVIKERAGQAVIYAVLTGDGHGAGLVELARVLREEGIGRFAVSEPAEAAALRKAGFVEEEILMLRSTTDREELERLVDLNVVCTISSVDTGLALNAVAENRSTVAEAHIQVDTGMGFGGFLVGEPEKILLAYRSLPNVALSGIYTQLHTSPSGKGQEVDAQLKQFHQVLDAIHAAGFETGLVHAAGSYALAMTSVGDTEEGFRRLGDALEEMDRSAGENGGEVTGQDGGLPENEMVCSSARIEELAWEEGCIRSVPLEACEGLVSMEYAYLYPPGIPLIVPGERVSHGSLQVLLKSRRQGFSLEGMEKEGSIRVWING